jgi:hypothetical protein
VDGAALEAIDEVARRLGPVAELDDRVRFVYLFGSLARGEVRPGNHDRYLTAVRERARRGMLSRG